MKARYGTLVASTVATVNLGVDFGAVEVSNLDGAAAIYFTVDGSTPTVAGSDTYALPAAISTRDVKVTTDGNTVVKLISSGTPTYAITAG